jgi:hypothetical protein
MILAILAIYGALALAVVWLWPKGGNRRRP